MGSREEEVRRAQEDRVGNCRCPNCSRRSRTLFQGTNLEAQRSQGDYMMKYGRMEWEGQGEGSKAIKVSDRGEPKFDLISGPG